MTAIFNWYNSQNAPWNRARRPRTPPSLAQSNSNNARGAAILRNTNTGHVVLNITEVAAPNINSLKEKENKDTLFGPSIGVFAPAPDWCKDPDTGCSDGSLLMDEKASSGVTNDELTPEIVKEWIKRSTNSSEPTTTLQALVNLKRPTIRLSPLARSEISGTNVSGDAHAFTQQHGLEFEFDCDAPRCGISLTVVGVPAHYADDHPQHEQSTKVENEFEKHLTLYETVVRGGFGRKLTLSDGAVLELAKVESAAQHARVAAAAAAAAAACMSNPALLKEEPNVIKMSSNAEKDVAGRTSDHPQRRFRFFRRRSHVGTVSTSGNNSSSNELSGVSIRPISTAGPALAVVDEEATRHREQHSHEATASADATVIENSVHSPPSKSKDEEGVKLLIRLSALDAAGSSLNVRNEQITYLHIVRHGPAPAPTSATGTTAERRESIESDEDSVTGAGGNDAGRQGTRNLADANSSTSEDVRPWVVKVVKREARIGQHTFQLHEIYGLSAHTVDSSASAPESPASPSQTHTYPPAPNLSTHNAADDASAASECLLCLSSPREVVLLPCRHLVACRECAVNMVEFGAGGPITHNDLSQQQVNVSPSTDANERENNTGERSVTVQAPPPPAPTTTRRKRKAKGWFCPVCRQPYTALLRITTAPPPAKASLGSSASSTGAGAQGDDEKKSEMPESPGETKHVSFISNRLSAVGLSADSDVALNRLPSLSLEDFPRMSLGEEMDTMPATSAHRDLERGL